MDYPMLLFSHEVRSFLNVSERLYRKIGWSGKMPKAMKMAGTCVPYYDFQEIYLFRESLKLGGSNEGLLEYLEMIDLDL